MRAIFPLIAVTGLSLGACAPYDVGLGESVRHHMALQVIDPHPEQQTELVEGGDGQRSAAAVQRYREGKVAIKTSTATTAGGSGGGSPK
jgi:hypothetical protein